VWDRQVRPRLVRSDRTRVARHEGFPVDTARSPGMRPVVSVPGAYFEYAIRSISK
jgi:hypothetical protein